MTKSKRLEKKYMCTGENFRDNAPIGDCGDTRPLIDWLVYLSGKDKAFLLEYFESDSNTTIVEYIKKSWGKRLEVVK